MQVVSRRRESEVRVPWLHHLAAARDQDHGDLTDTEGDESQGDSDSEAEELNEVRRMLGPQEAAWNWGPYPAPWCWGANPFPSSPWGLVHTSGWGPSQLHPMPRMTSHIPEEESTVQRRAMRRGELRVTVTLPCPQAAARSQAPSILGSMTQTLQKALKTTIAAVTWAPSAMLGTVGRMLHLTPAPPATVVTPKSRAMSLSDALKGVTDNVVDTVVHYVPVSSAPAPQGPPRPPTSLVLFGCSDKSFLGACPAMLRT